MRQYSNIKICAICGQDCKSLGRHIVMSHHINPLDYYNKYLRKSEIDGICLECGTQSTFKDLTRGFNKYCSISCSTSAHMTLSRRILQSETAKKGACQSTESKIKRVTSLKLAYATGLKSPGHGSGAFKTGLYTSNKAGSIRYRSSYELIAYQILDQLSIVKSYQCDPFRIPYIFKDDTHTYIPDILVTYVDNSQELIEVKPERFLLDEKVVAKSIAAKQYCVTLGIKYSLWTEKNLMLI